MKLKLSVLVLGFSMLAFPMSRFECTGAYSEAGQNYSANFDIVTTETFKAIVEIRTKMTGNKFEFPIYRVPNSNFGVLKKGDLRVEGDKLEFVADRGQDLSISFKPGTGPSRLDVDGKVIGTAELNRNLFPVTCTRLKF